MEALEVMPGVSGAVTSCPSCRRLMVSFVDSAGAVDCDPSTALAFGLLAQLPEWMLAYVDHQAFVLAPVSGPHSCAEAGREKWHIPEPDRS